MLKNNTNYYRDKYMYFTFNGVHSSKYNMFMINENDLTIENNLNESSEFFTAMFQEGVYYGGTQKTQKTFKRKCAAEGLTLSQYKALIKWLHAGTTGFLVFDSNPYWGWNVVLDQVGDAIITERHGSLIVELELVWKTIGSYLARNYYAAYSNLEESQIQPDGESMCTCNGRYNTSMLCNEYGIPVIYYEYDAQNQKVKNDLYCIQSVNNVYQYLNINYIGDILQDQTTLKISYNDETYVQLATKNPEAINRTKDFIIEYLGDAGLVLIDGGIFELDPIMNYHYQERGVLHLQSESPVELTSAYVDGANGQLILNKSEIDQLILNQYNYICLTRKIDNAAHFDTSQWSQSNFLPQYETYLFFLDDQANNLESRLEGPIEDEVSYQSMISDTFNSATIIAVDSLFTSQLTSPNAYTNSSIQLTYYNKLLQNEKDWAEFKCYIGKSNFISIECPQAKMVNNAPYINMTVTSLNNL